MPKQKPKPPHPGPPRQMEGGRRCNVYLGSEALAAAKRLGNGNVSAGIRAALERADK